MFKKILVCLDGSELSEQILPYAAAEALCFQGQLVLLQVVSEPVAFSPGIPGAGALHRYRPMPCLVRRKRH
jgi:hypothetical protein